MYFLFYKKSYTKIKNIKKHEYIKLLIEKYEKNLERERAFMNYIYHND